MAFLSSSELHCISHRLFFGLTSSGVTNCLLRGPTLPFSRAAVMKKEARPDGPLPIRVKSCPGGPETRLPLCLHQRTSTDRLGWSVLRQWRHSSGDDVAASAEGHPLLHLLPNQCVDAHLAVRVKRKRRHRIDEVVPIPNAVSRVLQREELPAAGKMMGPRKGPTRERKKLFLKMRAGRLWDKRSLIAQYAGPTWSICATVIKARLVVRLQRNSPIKLDVDAPG
jgi:hypothetical protein